MATEVCAPLIKYTTKIYFELRSWKSESIVTGLTNNFYVFSCVLFCLFCVFLLPKLLNSDDSLVASSVLKRYIAF